MFFLQMEVLMPDAATYLEYVDSTDSTCQELKANVGKNIGEAQDRQRTQYRKRKSVSGETVTFKEGQLVLVFNARKRGQKGKALEKKWLLPPRKSLRIEGKKALLEGMKGKTNILNLKHVPEGLSKDDFHTEHGSITRDIEHNDTEDARLTRDVVHNDTEHASPTRNI